MNVASIAVLAVLFALVGLAVWRNLKKGAPCACGGSHRDCGCGCGDACCSKGGSTAKEKIKIHQSM